MSIKNKKRDGAWYQKKFSRLMRVYKLWTALASITRFSLHGFVLSRIRNALVAIQDYNNQAMEYNRQARKERRRNRALKKNKKS